jgi:hypothetical protein
MSDDRVSWKTELDVLIIRIVLGVIASAILIPLLIVVLRRLRGQGVNRNSGAKGETPTPYSYRGKHAHQDDTHAGDDQAGSRLRRGSQGAGSDVTR